jgi:hypothetical protein
MGIPTAILAPERPLSKTQLWGFSAIGTCRSTRAANASLPQILLLVWVQSSGYVSTNFSKSSSSAGTRSASLAAATYGSQLNTA